jgi:hypothetical protein
MELWIVAGISVLLLAVLAAFAAAKVSRLLSAKHLSEISDGMASLKIVALKTIMRPGELYEKELYSDLVDKQTFVSSAGLGLMYTVSKQDNLYMHHISISLSSSTLAHSAAMTIAAWISYFLNIPTQKISVPPELSNAPGAVWHITFELSEKEESDYEQTRPRILAAAEITPALWKQIGPVRESIVERSLSGSKLSNRG